MSDYDTGMVVENACVYRDFRNRGGANSVKEGTCVMIDYERSYGNYYYVYTETSIEGYCLKEHIEVA